MRQLFCALAALLLTASCGGNDSPTTPTPTVVQVGGIWNFSETYATVAGGECFAASFQALVGQTGVGTLQVNQAGSAVTVVATDGATGGSCNYQGTAGTSSVALNLVSCTASDVFGAVCPNGAQRDLRIVTAGYNATVSGGSMSGTGAQTYNVLVSGTSSGVGTLTVTTRFSATRR